MYEYSADTYLQSRIPIIPRMEREE